MVRPARGRWSRRWRPVHPGQLRVGRGPSPQPRPRFFSGLVPGRQPPCFRATTRISPCCADRASAVGAQVVTFGYHEEADFRAPPGGSRPPRAAPSSLDMARSASLIASGRRASTTPRTPSPCWPRLGAAGADAMRCLPGLARVSRPCRTGAAAARLLDAPDGPILLIDESYNANPALGFALPWPPWPRPPRETFGRRVAVPGGHAGAGRGNRRASIAA